ncbi:ParB N-terminal domain-containing protein, partial [Streptomyces lavenduligriseus]
MTSTSLEVPPDGGSMIRLTEILHRSVKLRQRRFEMLPLRGQGAPFTEPHARNPSDSLPPSELADLISSMSVIGLLEPVLAEEIVVDGKAPTIRLVTGERRLRAMRWGAVNRPDNPHFQALPAVVCPGPLSEEERHMWRFVENFAREPLRPGEQAAALLYQRCAILVGKLLKAGKPVPQEVYAIPDPAERFLALEKIRGTDSSCAAPWSEVLDRLGLQLNERKAGELVRAFRALPRDLTEEMDEAAVRLNTRIRFAELRNGRAQAAEGIWAALKSSKRL